ncbi:MAG: hypothetical protein KDK41_15745 [Leptospiraceae bacterium]|nr:hypothetical protein [Leptospiraceae bacterium]
MRHKFNIVLLSFLIPVFTLSALVTFRSAFSAFDPQGVQKTISVVDAFRNIMNGVTSTPRAKKFIEFISSSLEDFDFSEIHDSDWLKPSSNQFRAITLEGKHSGAKYILDVTEKAPQSLDISKTGNSSFQYAIRKNEKSVVEGSSSFGAQVNFRLASGHLNDKNVFQFLSNLLSLLDAENLNSLKPSPTKYFSNQTKESRTLVDTAAGDFPSLMSFLNEYTSLASLVNIKEINGQKYTDFQMVGNLKESAVDKSYPEMMDWIDDLGDLVKIYFYLYDSAGNRILYLTLDPETRELKFGFFTAGGKIIPAARNGRPNFDAAFVPAELTSKSVTANVRISANISGLKFDTGYMTFNAVYRHTSGKGSINIKFANAPHMKMEGRFYKVVPVWLIDIAIPSNIEELMNKFVKVMLKGNNGKGTTATLKFQSANSAMHVVDGTVSTEILDNMFIRIGLKIWNRRFRPAEESLDDMRRFFADASTRVLNDLQKMK